MKRGSDSKDEDDTKDETNTKAKSQKITMDEITARYMEGRQLYMEGKQLFGTDVHSKLKMTADIRGELLQLRLTMTGLSRRERYGWLRQTANEFWKENCPLDRKNELVPTDKVIFIDAICGSNENGDGSLSKPLSTIEPLMLDSFWVTRQRRCMCVSRQSQCGGVAVRLLRCDPNICDLLPCSVRNCSGTICREHKNGYGIWEGDHEGIDGLTFDEFAVCTFENVMGCHPGSHRDHLGRRTIEICCPGSHEDHLRRCTVAFCSRHARDRPMEYEDGPFPRGRERRLLNYEVCDKRKALEADVIGDWQYLGNTVFCRQSPLEVLGRTIYQSCSAANPMIPNFCHL